ncbi:hypothetical protein SeMB42_g01772 [Synchytrium endobioticum]|uniref:Pre-rRNA-processing protein TSR2 n=1 Tax=Synchytrium endobioticum TaxID=286115 RepID=A0A507DJW6_9FUNG|nr:hypothetical protein SeLEV6574_g02205 [Synchytrium endobioticum]TPX51913.1 hypothetical protein SeMB42_g01772 [Synchytrium endobioticum]
MTVTQHHPNHSQTQFREAAHLIFHRWTALQIAISHQTAGPSTAQLASTLLDDVLSHIMSTPYTTLDAYDIAEGLEEYFISVLKISLEDESGLQVAKSMIKCFDMIVNKGDISELERLRGVVRESSGGMQAVGMSRMQGSDCDDVDGDCEEDNDDDDNAMDGDISVCAASSSSHSGTSKNKSVEEMQVDRGPIIDEDGFELVSRKGRRRQ